MNESWFNPLLLYCSGPEKPGNITITARGTDNLKIHWVLPEGSFEHYVVNISNEELEYFYSNTTTVNTAHFTDLYPGRIFVITVTAVAGNFTDTSEQSLFATCKFKTPYCKIVLMILLWAAQYKSYCTSCT